MANAPQIREISIPGLPTIYLKKTSAPTSPTIDISQYDTNGDGKIDLGDVPLDLTETAYHRTIHGTPRSILVKTSADYLVEANVISRSQREAFVTLANLYAHVKDFHSLSEIWARNSTVDWLGNRQFTKENGR